MPATWKGGELTVLKTDICPYCEDRVYIDEMVAGLCVTCWLPIETKREEIRAFERLRIQLQQQYLGSIA